MTIRNTRLRATTTLLAVLALVAGLAWPAAAAPDAPAAPDRPGAPTQPKKECDQDPGGGTHPTVDCDPKEPGNPDDPDNPNGPGGPGIDAAAECAAQYPGWADCVAVVNANGMHPGDICGYVIAPDQSLLHYYHPDAPDDYVLYYNVCPRDGLFYSEDTQANPGGGPAPPDPADVAADVWARVQGTLEQPALETWPPQNMSSVLNLPTYVAVTNWPAGGEVTGSGCDPTGAVCIDLTATPALTFDPGDGSAAVACPPGGTRFDRNGPPPEPGQDVDGCAHVYTQRTGVRGRAAAWPGEVTITWSVHWEENGGAEEEGDFDPFPLATDLPRVVTELRSVVTDITPSGQG